MTRGATYRFALLRRNSPGQVCGLCQRDQAEIRLSIDDGGSTRGWQLCGPCVALEYRGEAEQLFAARLARALLERAVSVIEFGNEPNQSDLPAK